jgi:hypothetical protein
MNNNRLLAYSVWNVITLALAVMAIIVPMLIWLPIGSELAFLIDLVYYFFGPTDETVRSVLA